MKDRRVKLLLSGGGFQWEGEKLNKEGKGG
jgi:hypothetical protein